MRLLGLGRTTINIFCGLIDGPKHKREFTSLYGVTLIGYYSKKIIDFVIKTGTDENTEWYEEHEEQCSATHDSTEKMEVDARNVFKEKFGIKYLNYIGDGDSKTYKTILNLNPYGNKFPIIKSEWISHVEKRMGTRLRNLKKNNNLVR
ncbi:hypothetical protein ACFW04_011898 [Cataglyphis niger]